MQNRTGRARRSLRLVAAAAVAAVALPGAGAPAPARAQEARTAGGLQEVGRMPLLPGPDYIKATWDKSGWLILDTRNRFAYQVFDGVGLNTVVQSFDLDTLAPRRRLVLAGIPITSGISDLLGPGGTQQAGEIVHAVDEEAGRLYLAMSEGNIGPTNARVLVTRASADGQRPLTRFVMIDERAFHRNDGSPSVASFKEPAAHARLHFFNVLALTVNRHHVPPGRPGRLVVTFAHPALGGGSDTSPAYAHTLAQWDVTRLMPTGSPTPGENRTEADTAPLDVDPTKDSLPEERVLDVCGMATMSPLNGVGEGNLQWEVLATPTALFTACQVSSGNGTVVEVPLGPGGSLVSPERLRTYPLAKVLADVVADQGRGRLLLRTKQFDGANPGVTVWVFDATRRRFTGAIALYRAATPVSAALGLGPATGRLYALVPDHGATAAGRTTPARGGLQVTDTRLDPAPPLENVRPDLAYPGLFRIRVDAPTNRVFVRLGKGTQDTRAVYPGTDTTAAPAPVDDFYRVFEDRIPVAEQPGEIDDSAFTTDVAEGELTRASYQADGSGFGARVRLVGGADAASSGAVSATASPCGKDDREALAGSVRQVSVSDLSVGAEAASLDADGRTQNLAPDVVDACGPEPAPDAPADSEQLAFDEPDGQGGRTNDNHWTATCLGDQGTRRQRGFTSGTKAGREAFEAEATCEQAKDRATASAEGALSLLGGTAPEPVVVRVGRSASEVAVRRVPGKGIEVRADSVARNIDIGGVASIAVVRAEAVSGAAGRPGRAGAGFSRTICGTVVVGQPPTAGCLNADQQRTFVEALNGALGSRGRARLRDPDPTLAAGSDSGYRASLQRHRDDVFEDVKITRDESLAVPGLELVLYQGDGNSNWGTGRQILQLAGVAASTSYGITCLYGQAATGRCAKPGEAAFDLPTPGGEGTHTVVVPGVTETITLPGDTVHAPGAAATARPARESRLRTVLMAPGRALAQALRLAFNNPRELGLIVAVWALLYAPCYLVERRRSIGGLRDLRATATGGTA